MSTSSQTVRHGDDDVGRAEAEAGLDGGLLLPVGDVLAQKILAGDAEVDAALADLAGDFGGGEEGDLDVGATLDAGAVFSVVAGQADGEPGPGERLERLVLEAALRGDGERDGHAAPPLSCSMRSSQTEKPTPGIGVLAPSRVSSRS